MFPNLRAEMARKNLTLAVVAEALDINISTLSAKLSTYDRLKHSESATIRDKFFPGLTIDYLFATK